LPEVFVEQCQPKGLKLAFGDFVLFVAEASLTCRGEPVPLAPKEFALLYALVSHAGHLVHKEKLIQEIWPDTFVSDSSLFRNISVLRKYVGNDSIRTVPKRGYIFTLHVAELENPDERAAGWTPASLIQERVQEPNAVHELMAHKANSADDSPRRASGVSPNASLESSLPQAPPVGETAARGIGACLRHRPALVVACAAAVLAVVAAVRFHELGSGPLHAANQRPASTGANSPEAMAGAVRLFLLNEHGNTLSVLNTLRNTVESTVNMDADPSGAAILPDGSAIYVALYHGSRVVTLDTHSRRILASIPVGNGPVGVAANPRPPFVYVANNYSNSVSVIDSRTNTLVRELHVGSVPTEIGINGDGTRAIVTNQSGGSITLIDTVANTVMKTIPVGSTPVGIAFTPDSKSAWITLAGQREIALIDVDAAKVAQRIRVGPGPVRVAITPDGRFALVSSFFSNTLTVVDTALFRTIGTIPVGLNPVGIAFNPAGDVAYVANYGSNTVSLIEMRTLTVSGTMTAGVNPVDMVVLPCYAQPC
jgi:YVTN family beta-propeller protein